MDFCPQRKLYEFFQQLIPFMNLKDHLTSIAGAATAERRLKVDLYSLQENLKRGHTHLLWIDGTENPADLMTKYLVRDKMDACMHTIGQENRQGRAKSGLDVQGASSQQRRHGLETHYYPVRALARWRCASVISTQQRSSMSRSDPVDDPIA